jgi:diguanylate cyclase (GGDEF)-like protein
VHLGLDDFKLVNDSLGHAAGDEVLLQVAERLRERIRETHLVARPGGDEFCILIADLDADPDEVIEIVVGQAMVAVQEPLSVDGKAFQLGASAGASVFPRDARDVDSLLGHADSAMHDAKQDGRGSFNVYAGGTQEALERLMLTSRLREALEQNHFVLHFQPIFSLTSGEVVAVEALLRWQDAQHGLMPPRRFIPVAEYTGLIEPIGEWVIDAACAELRAWRDAGITVPMAINVSLRQFQSPGLGKALRAGLSTYDLEPSQLTVEITESTAMRDPACVEPVMEELREIGLRVAIDDFGTGYSSLGRLRDLPVDVVKIDRSLLVGVPGDPVGEQMAVAALTLVRTLGMEAVAEGIENEWQRRFLLEHGCPMGQGFHLAVPMPAEEVRALLPRS